MANIGKRVARLREEKGWSQLELAQRMEVDNSVISKIEKETRKVSSDELDRFATIFGVSADTLLGRKTTDHGDSGTLHPYDLADDEPLTYHGVELPDNLRTYYKSVADAYVKQHHKGDDNDG